jgi:hypothetical protein
MKLRCRVYKTILLYYKLGNKARNVSRPGALHTPSLRLDFFVLLFGSRQKVVKEKSIMALPYSSPQRKEEFILLLFLFNRKAKHPKQPGKS